MTNDELKKKILEIFEKAIGDWYEKDDGLFAEGYTPEEGDNRLKAFMADALIAAGIGDVKEIKYRVRRAEKALYIACRETAEIIFKDDFDRHAQEYMYGYLKQAEKELSEEGKE